MKTGYDRKEQIEMSEYGYIVKMKCLTNMHVGDGEENYSIIDKMVERLEDDEDVQNVYTNMKPASEDEE